MTYENNGSVLAVYPTTRGYGFVLFESAGAGADWGARFIEGELATRSERVMKHVEKLLDQHRTDFLLLESIGRKSRRSKRLRYLQKAIEHAANVRAVEVVHIDRQDIQAVFLAVGAKTRDQIADAVAREFPALAHRIPRKRKDWLAETPTMAMFNAAALAITFYGHSELK